MFEIAATYSSLQRISLVTSLGGTLSRKAPATVIQCALASSSDGLEPSIVTRSGPPQTLWQTAPFARTIPSLERMSAVLSSGCAMNPSLPSPLPLCVLTVPPRTFAAAAASLLSIRAFDVIIEFSAGPLGANSGFFPRQCASIALSVCLSSPSDAPRSSAHRMCLTRSPNLSRYSFLAFSHVDDIRPSPPMDAASTRPHAVDAMPDSSPPCAARRSVAPFAPRSLISLFSDSSSSIRD
mmetsp:Transcript_3990/g.17648  ORF Transcript_3990/g.17648 Transcript_3990/m.17648 type:complete len:238 (+) Transcript_3990:414-1127(+)